MKKGIITVVGKDHVGIIGRVCTYLAEGNVNILDISQTIMDGYFNMMMVVDITNLNSSFEVLAEGLEALGKELGMIIRIQHTEIFDSMHRI
ncbi:MAG: ACT domain-containing protein [Epulopiscium sp.]|jgi:ACT domain-containing protein|nr:ACT domain-containing protein [Candidatus Epulonipiscium sp.]